MPLHLVAFRALNPARHVLIRQFINNNVKLFNINRITKEPDFYPLVVFFPEPAQKIVLYLSFFFVIYDE